MIAGGGEQSQLEGSAPPTHTQPQPHSLFPAGPTQSRSRPPRRGRVAVGGGGGMGRAGGRDRLVRRLTRPKPPALASMASPRSRGGGVRGASIHVRLLRLPAGRLGRFRLEEHPTGRTLKLRAGAQDGCSSTSARRFGGTSTDGPHGAVEWETGASRERADSAGAPRSRNSVGPAPDCSVTGGRRVSSLPGGCTGGGRLFAGRSLPLASRRGRLPGSQGAEQPVGHFVPPNCPIGWAD